MRRALACLAVAFAACNPANLPLPAGHQIHCTSDEQCPGGLKCDKEIATGRCVETIAPSPTVTLTVDQLVGSRPEPFEFTATATNAATFDWEYVAGESAPVRLNETGAVVAHTFTELGAREFCAPDCEDAIAVTVKVTVRSAEGKTASSETTVVVLNFAPVADFGDDLFISEENVGQVTLDLCGGGAIDAGCTTSDPDGDELRFLGFRQLSGPDAGPLGLAQRVTITPPQGPHRPMVFEGVVTDGVRESTGRIAVHRGAHGWLAIGTIDQTYRVHPDFRAVERWATNTGTETFFGPVRIEADSDGGWWVADATDGSPALRTLIVHLDGSLKELVADRFEVTGIGRGGGSLLPIRSFVPPRPGQSGCLAFHREAFDGGGSEPETGFARFTPGQPLTIAHSSLKADGGVHQPFAVLPVGTTGDCWAVRLGESDGFNGAGGAVAQLTAQGQWVGERALAGMPHAVATEADGTLWVVERFPVPFDDGGLGIPLEGRYRGALTRFSAEVTEPPQSFELTSALLSAIAPSAGGGLWGIELGNDQLVRVAPDGTVSTTEVITGGGTVFGGPAIRADPVSGELWVRDPEAALLRHFAPTADGGLQALGVLSVDDLPDGVNRKGFDGDLAIDPLSGNLAVFSGQAPNGYQRLAVVPPHGRRVERVFGVQNAINSVLRGSPIDGTHWVADGLGVRRIDVRARALVEVSNDYLGRLIQPPPMVVDRQGRAWVGNTAGVPALRAINPDGSDGGRLVMPFLPSGGVLASALRGSTLAEHGCFWAETAAARIDFAQQQVATLTIPSGEKVVRCAINSSGDAWLFTTSSLIANAEITARLYRRTETTSAWSTAAEPASPAGIGIMGAVADEGGTQLFFGTWHYDTYGADLRRVTFNQGSVTTLTTLQGNVGGVNVLGIPISLGSRQVCSGNSPACVELWVSTRTSELRRYDSEGNELERTTIGQNEGPLDLVP